MPIPPRIDGLRDYIKKPITEEHTSGKKITALISQVRLTLDSSDLRLFHGHFHGHQDQKSMISSRVRRIRKAGATHLWEKAVCRPV
jgi:hypothetical protein